jgi:hypothetical protein
MDNQEVINLYNKTKNYSRTGRLLGVSRQRVFQIVNNYTHFGRNGRKKKYKNFEMCEVCNQSKAKILHHIDFNNQNDDSTNLLPVCEKCHLIIHKASGRKRSSWRPSWIEI